MDKYLTLTEAARLLEVSRWTLYRRIDEGALTVYQSPSNRRVRLVKRSDVEQLLTPKIATRDAIPTDYRKERDRHGD
jgi:excisionase family DNA binding protein